jgi:RNA polymerase sigma-70 factor (ECF subfamily)
MSEPKFGALAAPHLLDQLFAHALRLTRSRADAQDLVQATVERGLRHFDRFSYGSLAVWLTRVMYNLFVDDCRRRKHETVQSELELDQVAPCSDSLPERPPEWTRVSDHMLEEAVNELEPLSRAIFMDHEVEGLRYEEIARKRGIPIGTVGTRLYRARRRMRATLLRRAEAGDPALEVSGD